MQGISVYKYKDLLVFVPKGYQADGPTKLIEPLEVLDFESGDEIIGDQIIKSLNNSHKLSSPPKTSVFKEILKLSKARSNSNLVSKGQLIQIDQIDDEIKFEKMKSNIKYKAFVANEDSQKSSYNICSVESSYLGRELKAYLSDSDEIIA